MWQKRVGWRWHYWRETAVFLLLLLLFSVGPVPRPARAEEWAGDRYSLVVTDETAVAIANWVLDENPKLPFTDPVIAIHPDGISGSGTVELWDLRVPISGTASVFVEDGRPNGRIESLTVAGAKAPAFVLKAIGDVRSLVESAELTIVVTKIELGEGELLVEGVYR